jgi:hypothetical protein
MNDILARFKENLADVDRLVNFDKEVLEIVVINVRALHQELRKTKPDDRYNGGRLLTMIEGIRTNCSLKPKYSAIFNQALVLLVAHFSTALGDLFRHAVAHRLEAGKDSSLMSEEIKLTFSDMKDRDWSLKSTAADYLIAKYDFTFQDMASTVRAFDKYVGVRLPKDERMHNIITAQACRHVIAHSGGLISERAARQVVGAKPRSLRESLVAGEKIHFSVGELSLVKEEMLKFVESLSDAISDSEKQ